MLEINYKQITIISLIILIFGGIDYAAITAKNTREISSILINKPLIPFVGYGVLIVSLISVILGIYLLIKSYKANQKSSFWLWSISTFCFCIPPLGLISLYGVSILDTFSTLINKILIYNFLVAIFLLGVNCLFFILYIATKDAFLS